MKLLPLIAMVLMSLLVLISLPNPFNPLTLWLEKLVGGNIDCQCLCPWWIFLILQICLSLVLLWFARAEIKPSRTKYMMYLAFIGLFSFLFHLLVHNYFIIRQVFEASVFCSYSWLGNVVLILLFSIFKIKKDS